MRKVMNMVIGGLQQKIFNLVLITLVLTVAAYSVVLLFQNRKLADLSAETNERQEQSMEEISSESMEAIVQETLNKDTRLEADLADSMFSELRDQVVFLGGYASALYADPERYPSAEVEAPDPEKDGEISVQLLTEAGVDPEDPETAASIGLAGNMAQVMEALAASSGIDACYIATEEGVMVIADAAAGVKFNENGEQRDVRLKDRPWYVGAKETGGIYFSDVELNQFTGQMEIVCSMPVYRDGKPAAVIGIDLSLDSMEEDVAASGDPQTSFVCIINRDGHVVFAPETQELFSPADAGNARDLRRSENTALADFVSDSMAGETGVRVVSMGNRDYYMAGAPVETVGWALVSVLDVEATRQPVVQMQEQYAEIYEETVLQYKDGSRHSRDTIIALVFLIFAAGSAAALSLARRIVGPLNMITKRIAALGGNNIQFMMEDEYRTGDEVEVLAESFAAISAKTVRYMDEIRTVTAEKERISVELEMANAIQVSQLPHLFPAFPDRKEFDIYAFMMPAKEVGGDFYDFFLVDDDHLCLVMADVSGKGVPAALFMMVSRILIRNNIQSGRSPAQALADTSEHLLEGNEEGLFVTVWLAILEISTGRGVAANAGHEHPVLRRAGGSFEMVKYRHSPAVATLEGISYREHDFKLNPGDSLFVYTDGVTEASDEHNRLFGEERLLEALNDDPDRNPEDALRSVMRGINGFSAGAEQFDDITMLCLKYFGPEGEDSDGH